MRKTNQNGIDLIKHHEGFRADIYLCPSGFKTIGYGHKILEGEQYTHISEKEAREILERDLLFAENAVQRYIKAPINDNQFAAIVSFVYNLGSGVLQRSSLRQKINYNYEDYESIQNELLKWVYAGGRRLRGLMLRRKDEAILYAME